MSKAEWWSQRTERVPAIRARRPGLPRGRGPLVALGVALVLVLAAGGLALYSSGHDGRIYRGVRVMGVDVSGQTPAQARATLLSAAARYGDAPLTVRQGAQEWRVAPRALGLSLQVDPLVREAYAQGRSGSGPEQLWRRTALAGAPAEIAPRYRIDRNALQRYVRSLEAPIARAPIDSQLSLRADGSLVASAERAGQKLDAGTAVRRLGEHIGGLRSEAVELPVLPVAPGRVREDWRDAVVLRRAMASDPVRVRFGDETWSLRPRALAGAVEEADGGEVVGRFDAAAMEKLLAPVAAGVYRDPVDATLAIRDARPVLTPERPGEELDPARTLTAIYSALPAGETARVATRPVPVAVRAADLEPARRELAAMLGSPLVLRHGEREWTARPGLLARWVALSVDRESRSATIRLRESRMRDYLTAVREDVLRQPRDARLEVRDARPVLVPDLAGEKLDTAGTLRSLTAALSGSHEARVSVTVLPVRVTAADLQPAKRRLDALLSTPVTLRFEDETWQVTPERLAAWTRITVDDRRPRARVSLDEAAVRAYIQGLVGEIYQEPRDGRLVWVDGWAVTDSSVAGKPRLGNLAVLEESLDGHELDVEKATSRLLGAAFAEKRVLDLPVTVTAPRVPTDDLAALGIREAIGEGASKFTDSPDERVHNIHTSAAYLDGAVVAPGETFSFNEAIGEISLARGYEEGLTILEDSTVPGVGGGVCQVSTTTFRAAFWAGLPIVERNQHSYLVSFYQLDGSPEGFDAAVYQPYVDLKWENTTGRHILVQAYWGEDDLRVVLYGTDPGLDVQRSEPYISNRKPPLPTKIVKVPTMPRGAREQKEWAHEGMDVTLYRTVSRNGKVLFQDSFYSSYKPWGDVYHVGPPALTPKPAKPGEKPKPGTTGESVDELLERIRDGRED